MEIEFGSEIEVNELRAIPVAGSFALGTETLEWVKCRDHFRKKLNENTPGFFFSHRTDRDQPERIASFIAKFERILEISDPSKFHKTTRTYALWIRPSKFWLACWMRRSLLTILLRCGMDYDYEEDNFDDVLFEHEYIKTTKGATVRFLYGFTKYVGPAEQTIGWGVAATSGWWNVFHNQPDECVRRYLVSSEGEAVEPCLIGVGALWT